MEKSTALISVIIPVYNTEKYLGKCLESVICQTYKNLEIICINDGSTDGSKDILDYYAKADKRIRVINQDNAGMSVARNVGMRYASGKYVSFIDSDDIIKSDFYQNLLVKAEDFDCDVVECGYCLVKKISKKIISLMMLNILLL